MLTSVAVRVQFFAQEHKTITAEQLKSGISRSQVGHTTTQQMGKAVIISGVGSNHIGD